jgi:hypothetical protein
MGAFEKGVLFNYYSPYQGDIAYVIKVDDSHQKATLRIVPRFALEN